jgi:ATP:ADP antiporter, AAA family
MKFLERFLPDVPDSENRIKAIFLSVIFFIIIGAYGILRPLKVTIFLSMVGREYQPLSKILSMLLAIPFILLYSFIVDRFKKHQIIYFFSVIFSVVGILFSFLLRSPGYGLANTVTSPHRFVGWAFLIFMDLFAPFVMGSFWAFANSINTPKMAKASYGFITGAAKPAGVLTASIGLFFLSKKLVDCGIISTMIFVASAFLFLVGVLVLLMRRMIPHSFLKSYEELMYEKTGIQDQKKAKAGIWQGLWVLLKNPYVFGVFVLFYSFEAVSVIFEYQLEVGVSIAKNNAIIGMTSFMFLYMILAQGLSFLFAWFLTPSILRRFKIKYSLLIMPVAVIGFVFMFSAQPKLYALLIIMVLFRSLNNGINAPIRENLYIPTARNVRFKSKSWIDSFGRMSARASGGIVNMASMMPIAMSSGIAFGSVITVGLVCVWSVVSFFVGEKYEDVVQKGEVIGSEESTENT